MARWTSTTWPNALVRHWLKSGFGSFDLSHNCWNFSCLDGVGIILLWPFCFLNFETKLGFACLMPGKNKNISKIRKNSPEQIQKCLVGIPFSVTCFWKKHTHTHKKHMTATLKNNTKKQTPNVTLIPPNKNDLLSDGPFKDKSPLENF